MRWIIALSCFVSHLAMANDLTEWKKLTGEYRSQDYFRCSAMNSVPGSCGSSAKMGTSRWMALPNGQGLTGLVLEVLGGYSLNSTATYQFIVPAEIGETQVTSTGLSYKYSGPLQVNCGFGFQHVNVSARVDITYLSSDRSQFRLDTSLEGAGSQCSGTFSKIFTRK